MAQIIQSNNIWMVTRNGRIELYTTDHAEAIEFAWQLNCDRQDLYGRY